MDEVETCHRDALLITIALLTATAIVLNADFVVLPMAYLHNALRRLLAVVLFVASLYAFNRFLPCASWLSIFFVILIAAIFFVIWITIFWRCTHRALNTPFLIISLLASFIPLCLVTFVAYGIEENAVLVGGPHSYDPLLYDRGNYSQHPFARDSPFAGAHATLRSLDQLHDVRNAYWDAVLIYCNTNHIIRIAYPNESDLERMEFHGAGNIASAKPHARLCSVENGYPQLNSKNINWGTDNAETLLLLRNVAARYVSQFDAIKKIASDLYEPLEYLAPALLLQSQRTDQPFWSTHIPFSPPCPAEIVNSFSWPYCTLVRPYFSWTSPVFSMLMDSESGRIRHTTSQLHQRMDSAIQKLPTLVNAISVFPNAKKLPQNLPLLSTHDRTSVWDASDVAIISSQIELGVSDEVAQSINNFLDDVRMRLEKAQFHHRHIEEVRNNVLNGEMSWGKLATNELHGWSKNGKLLRKGSGAIVPSRRGELGLVTIQDLDRFQEVFQRVKSTEQSPLWIDGGDGATDNVEH